MNFYQFLLYIGVIHIFFSFIWKWFFIIPVGSIFYLIGFQKYGMRLVKIFGAYLMVSLMGWVTLSMANNQDLLSMLLYAGIGLFVLFITYSNNYFQVRKDARESMDSELLEKIQKENLFDITLIVAILIFYIFILFNFSISSNFLVTWVFNTIGWIYHLPIIGNLIGFFGILYILSLFIKGISLFIGSIMMFKSVK
jgi:hypothetical protein